jgi:hypothetical protein
MFQNIQMKEDDEGRDCGMRIGEQKLVQVFVGQAVRREVYSKA